MTRNRPALLVEDVIARHFPALGPAPAPPRLAAVVEPSHRDDSQRTQLAILAAANALRKELEAQTEDRLDILPAVAVATATVVAWLQAQAELARTR
jgi:hypothetical protein